VTIAQKAVSAIDASVAEATCSVVMSSWDQLPFIVSRMPYNTAKPANSQNAGGTWVAQPPLTAVLAEVCSGSLTLKNTSTESSTGRPHQNPSPTNTATNTAESATHSNPGCAQASHYPGMEGVQPERSNRAEIVHGSGPRQLSRPIPPSITSWLTR
jgi:hypothetical protein